ncbi:molybdopterin/thiamine biosynthesis adenylyltransferase [Actinocrispum wychmicini]|uniref:Molybdopterin/thiamine biosynthesis adenylyltransferase n=2 Tax=Actinocrispum wychmicini TaxID=1213861 RepID=A0A4R2J9P7_9PSEU|nr:molybdopterin/thiamine biosynthesis adenylyltransferase [Actinocrispum wychmicini]
MRPQLKSIVWERVDRQLRLVYDVRDQFVLDDEDGAVEALLVLLRAGGRTVSELAAALGEQGRQVPVDDVVAAVEVLDHYRLLEDGGHLGRLDETEQERYFSNLAFFESFGSLARSREDFQERLRGAHVLVLGTGGLNSNTIPHMCGLGVGRLTLLDRDAVELRNFARQYLYRRSDLGAHKVAVAADWVRAFDPAIKVDAVEARIDSVDSVTELLDRFRPDLVMSGVDSPVGIDGWVNDACVSRRTPYVRGGMYVTQGVVWSVNPGVSGCLRCSPDDGPGDDVDPQERSAAALFRGKPRANRGIGPVAGLLGAFCAFEVLRYLTDFEPPAHAGRPLIIDFANACATRNNTVWQRDPSCAICGSLGPTTTFRQGGETE